jgi:hypothetical protein
MRSCTILAALILLLAGGPAVAADAVAATGQEKAKPKEQSPACMHCGATCRLEAVCVCECGVKKKPKTEYEATCDPICVPRCSSLPWPFSRCRHGSGCTDCQSNACLAWVRHRKKLVKETKDEEVPVTERTVKYICSRCDGRQKTDCCGGKPAGEGGWWRQWLPVLGTP